MYSCLGFLLVFCSLISIAESRSGQYTSAQQQQWLKLHNEYRSTKQLPYTAADMIKLEWSNEMATKAESWAKQCNFNHYVDGSYGQNLYMDMGSTGSDDSTMITESMKGWGAEEKVGDVAKLRTPSQGQPVGVGIWDHYTQIVWSSTKTVGCGFATCNGNQRMVVCNYFPAGNIDGAGWYTHGPTCSKCPSGSKCDSDGLCSFGPVAPSSNSNTSEYSPPVMVATPKPGNYAQGVYQSPTPKPTTAKPCTPAPTTPAPTPAPTTPAPTPAPTTSAPVSPSGPSYCHGESSTPTVVSSSPSTIIINADGH